VLLATPGPCKSTVAWVVRSLRRYLSCFLTRQPLTLEVVGITQILVNEGKGLTVASGLRSILRHDPDKIMVGEICDRETAQLAINSALTGHLVLTTVYANKVFDVPRRFVNMGVEPYSFVSALNGILARRQLRVICDQCRGPMHFDSLNARRAALTESGLEPTA